MSKSIQALILDIDGVIWRNKVPIGDLKAVFKRITELGLKYAFATNNSSKTIDTYVELLSSFGVPVTKQQVNTSASVTAQYLSEIYPAGGEIFVIGMQGLKQSLSDAGFTIGSSAPLSVVVGLDDTFNYQTLKQAADFVRDGVPFIGTNPDVSLPIQNGINPGTGSLLAAVQAASGVAPQIIGKPKPDIFGFSLQNLGARPDQTLVIGDRLETDISGGQGVGCKVGVVLSGITSRDQAAAWQPKIDFIADDLTSLIEEIDDRT